ncbi:MAG: GNAT family N-acetyltransferase [Thermofilaceae archaeon]|nr:GNAT family N-acetyltransferase [Thermofilaceae archaeon]
MTCIGAGNLLYARFFNEPLLAKLFKNWESIRDFFQLIVKLAHRNFFTLACLRCGSGIVAAAVYVSETRPSVHVLELARLLASFSPRVLASFPSQAREFLNYFKAIRGLKPRCHLLFIASAYKRRGYGSKLLKLVENCCAKSGCNWIVLDVYLRNPALHFYLKRGYKPITLVKWWGVAYVVMAKRLK